MSNVRRGDAAFKYTEGGQDYWHHLGHPLHRLSSDIAQMVSTFRSADLTTERRISIGSGVHDLTASIRWDGQRSSFARFMAAARRGVALEYFPSMANGSLSFPCVLVNDGGIGADSDFWWEYRSSAQVTFRRTDGGTWDALVSPALFYYTAGNDVEGLTFTRPTVGKYSDESGTVSEAASGVSRTEFLGGVPHLLLEDSRTNLALYSEDFGNAAWGKTRATLDSNAYNAPDGSANGDRLVEDSTASSTHYISQTFTKAASSLPYSFSVWARQASRDHIHLELRGASSSHAATVVFDLSAGTIDTAAATVGSFSNASAYISAGPTIDGFTWYRCTLTATTDTDTNLDAFIVAHDGASITYTGTGSQVCGLFGAQLEQAESVSSYVVTTASSATRDADTWYADFPHVPQSLTVYVKATEIGNVDDATTVGLVKIGSASSGANPRLLIYSASNEYRAVYETGAGAVTLTGLSVAPTYGDEFELRVVLQATDLLIGQSIAGAAETTDNSAHSLGFAGAFAGERIYLNSRGSAAQGLAAIQSVKVAPGVRTLAYMRSY